MKQTLNREEELVARALADACWDYTSTYTRLSYARADRDDILTRAKAILVKAANVVRLLEERKDGGM